MSIKLGYHIPPNCFEKGLIIRHIGPILVNRNAKIGKNCTLHINTAIVASGDEGKAPIIGDNCVLSIGSTILGDVVLGNNVTVGAGAVVNKCFESNTIVAGVPAKIIKIK